MTMDLVIRGDLVTPAGVVDSGWAGVVDGVIAATGSNEPPAARQTVDHKGKLVFPGVVDGQTHAGSIAGFDGLHGMGLSGRVCETWLRGCRAFDGRNVHSRPGDGAFVRPV